MYDARESWNIDFPTFQFTFIEGSIIYHKKRDRIFKILERRNDIFEIHAGTELTLVKRYLYLFCAPLMCHQFPCRNPSRRGYLYGFIYDNIY